MNKLKCVESDDHTSFVPGEEYNYDAVHETVTGRDGEDWYFETHKTGLIALCGLDVTFEVAE